MSEEKPLPCAFCAMAAKTLGQDILIHCFCPNTSCVFSNPGIWVETWNTLQYAIMAQRRKDFAAGFVRALTLGDAKCEENEFSEVVRWCQMNQEGEEEEEGK